MQITIEDNRTPEQLETHRWAVVARDKFMSGWGQCKNGTSRCAWAVGADVNIDRVYNWVKHRDEMRHVNIVDLETYRPPAGTQHFHIYVVNADHVAARF